MERFSYDDLPERIDCVLITHNHQDHFVLETLLRLRPRIECLVAPKAASHLFGDISLKLLGQKLNFKSVIELDAMESLKLMADIEIVAVPFLGEHGDLAHSKTAYIVRAGHEQIMFAADSNCLDRRMYEHVRRVLGPVQTVFIGTECVGAPLTWNNGHLFLRPPTREQDQSRRYRGCDSSGALDLLEALGSKRVFNYAMGREPWLEHLLGLGLNKDSPQLREGQKLVQRAHGRGFLAAESLLGRAEIFLEARGSRHAAPGPTRQTNSDTLCRQQASSPYENWRHYFAGALDIMTPPREVKRFSRSHRARGLPGESRFARSSVRLASELSRALSEFAAIRECDRYLLFMAAAALLFSSANGQNEVVVDTLLTNENLRLAKLSEPDLPKKSILRIDLSGGLSFTTLIARVHEVVARAAARPELAFDELIGFLREPQSEKSNAPFRLKFIFDADDVTASSQPMPAREEILNGLALAIVAEGNSFTAFADFDGKVLDETFVKQLLNDYQSLLRAAISDPQHAIATAPIHDEEQKVFVTGLEQTNDSEDQFIF